MSTLSTIYIVEDQRVMLQTLEAVLGMQDGLSVAGVAQDAATALESIPDLSVDLALVDVSLPNMSGLELVQALQEHAPDVRCLMLSGRTEPEYVREARSVGAAGFVLKGDPKHVVNAIRVVLDGGEYVTPRLEAAWTSQDTAG